MPRRDLLTLLALALSHYHRRVPFRFRRSWFVALAILLASMGCSSARVSKDAHSDPHNSDISSRHTAAAHDGALSAAASATGPASANESPEPTADASTPTESSGKESDPHCVALPLKRPKDVSIRFTRVILPIAGPMTREGIELHSEIDCPMTTGPRAALSTIPCRRITPHELDRVYAELVHSGFTQLKTEKDAYGSPHYGSLTITVYWQDGSCEIDDSSTHMLVKSSAHVFYRLIDVIVSAGAP